MTACDLEEEYIMVEIRTAGSPAGGNKISVHELYESWDMKSVVKRECHLDALLYTSERQ